MCEDQPYDSKSDIWALGCVLYHTTSQNPFTLQIPYWEVTTSRYEMATLRHAFDAHNLPALVLKILKGDYPPIPQVYSKDLANLVKSMLRTDPKERPSIHEVSFLNFFSPLRLSPVLLIFNIILLIY
jgi:NIMA (never in mitosis gene a)-related kinase